MIKEAKMRDKCASCGFVRDISNAIESVCRNSATNSELDCLIRFEANICDHCQHGFLQSIVWRLGYDVGVRQIPTLRKLANFKDGGTD